MHTLAEIRTELLRLKWLVAAARFELAMRRHALALKAGFNPQQPRIPAGEEGAGQWVSSGDGEESDDEAEGGEATDISGAERPRVGRLGAIGIVAEAAQRLIEAFRSENGFQDLFGYSANRAVAVTTVDGEMIFGSSGRSPTFTDADRRDAERVRAILIDQYPEVMNTQNIGQFPNDALYHAEANVLMRAATRFGGSLSGRELDIHVDRPMCRSCETLLPLLSRELGNPTVRIYDKTHRILMLRDGSWVR